MIVEIDVCHLEIYECSSNPCQNGKCVNLVNGYRCICNKGITGNDCHQGKKILSIIML